MTSAPPTVDYSVNDDSIFASVARRPSLAFILGSAALFLLTLVAYHRVFNADFVWDDDYYVTNNKTLQTLDGLQRIWFEPGATTQYYPLVHTTFWIEHHIWELNPRGYHITNVLLHALGASLLWTLLKRLNVPGAWAAAAVFALHPIHVESVAWISERKNVLSGVFYFGAMLVYLRYCALTPAPAPSLPRGPDDKREHLFALPTDPTRLYALIVVLFAAALLSKSVTATFPAAVLVIMWWKRGKLTWSDVVPLLPLFAMGAAMGVFTAVLERDLIGASGKDWDYAPTLAGEFAARCIIAGRAIWFYVAKLFVPHPLIFNYPRFSFAPSNVALYLFPAGAIGALVSLWGLRHRIGRGPLAAWLLFVGSLVPVLGFLNVYPMRYSFVADHFAYLPSVALIVLLVATLKRGCDRLVAERMLAPSVAPAMAVMLLIVAGAGTILQSAIYYNRETLLEATIKLNSRSWWAANNYADWILNNDSIAPRVRFEKAEIWARRTMKLKPDHPEARIKLGLIAMQRGDNAGALSWFEDAVKQQPSHPLAQFNMARMLMRMNRNEEALAAFQKLVHARPDYEEARTNLGILLMRFDQNDAAIEQFQHVLLLSPDSSDAYYNLGQALLRAGRLSEALQAFQNVLTLEPKNVQVRLTIGDLAMQQQRLTNENRWAEAEAQYNLALKYDPNLAQAYHQLGMVRMDQDRVKEAIPLFEKAVELAPKNAMAKKSLDDAREELLHPSTRPTTRRSTTRGASSTQPSSMISAPQLSSPATTRGTP